MRSGVALRFERRRFSSLGAAADRVHTRKAMKQGKREALGWLLWRALCDSARLKLERHLSIRLLRKARSHKNQPLACRNRYAVEMLYNFFAGQEQLL